MQLKAVLKKKLVFIFGKRNESCLLDIRATFQIFVQKFKIFAQESQL